MNTPSKIFKTLLKIYPLKFSLDGQIYPIIDDGIFDREVGTPRQLISRLNIEIKSQKGNAKCYRINKEHHYLSVPESMSPRVAHEHIKHDLKQMLILTDSNQNDFYVRTIDNNDVDKLTMSDINLIAIHENLLLTKGFLNAVIHS